MKETLLVGLCIQESALANQIETVERRALRFDNLGKTHQFWDEFELLSKKQKDVLAKIEEVNMRGLLQQRSNSVSVEVTPVTADGTTSTITSSAATSTTLSPVPHTTQSHSSPSTTNKEVTTTHKTFTIT